MTANSIYATLGLSRNPFPPTPDAGSYFFTPRLEEDFAEIVHCIEARKGFVLLTGEVGLGKSTLVRRLLDTLSGKNCHSALILNTFLQDSALLSAIQSDFGLPPSDSLEQGLARLTEFLIAGHQAGEISLLVIDDAQNLSVESLELVRLLCNLETGQEKLLQILLVGQPELEETLATPELRQLKSRIIKHARLSGLQKDEVTRYFDFRVNAAGAEGRLSIEPAAADVLHRATQGNLRRIHLVLDRCLYGLASTRASVVTESLVQRAVADLPALGAEAAAIAKVTGGTRGRKAWVLAGLLAGTTATVALASWGLATQPGEHVASAAAVAAAPTPEVVRPAVSGAASAVPPNGSSEAAVVAAAPAPKLQPSAGVSGREACETQLKAAANADEVVHVYRLPDGMGDTLKPSTRLCRFNVDKESWVAWLGRNNTRNIEAAEQVTRKVQAKLKSMGLLDKREPDDGFFGSKTGEAFARFQLQQGLPPTGKPDELTFLILEHQDASPAESLLEASGQVQPAGLMAQDRLAVLRDKSPSLGAALVNAGVVSTVAIDYVLQKQKIEKVLMGNLLVELGFASAKEVARQLADQRGLRFVSADEMPEPDTAVAGIFNRSLCLTYGFLPVRENDEGLIEVVLGDAQPDAVTELVQRKLGKGCHFFQGEFDRVAQAIQQHYYFAEHPPARLIESEVRKLDADVDRAYSPARLLEHMLHLAVRERATDIHLAPTARSRSVLLRVDGVLRPVFALSPALDRLVVYVKLQADMDASEQRLPQDGSFAAQVMEHNFTIRVSTLISEFGERMVLRLLPERSNLDKLADLGFLEEDVAVMAKAFSRPHGLILITGPTGSGKSTTLHAALRMQPLIERNVLTVEDPVEYRVPVACQTEVNRRAGYEFANAMRHFLRHDPDIILVGEIRDSETARAALDASSTGHLVLSTLHVGSIFGVMPRLKLLGVDTETIAENLVAVINQRLVRRICPHCAKPRLATDDERRWLGQGAAGEMLQVFHGAGCHHCRDTGYLGRLPVYEMLVVNRDLADAIASDATRAEMRQRALAAGMRPILTLARHRVLAGETTMEEILRTVGED